MFIVPMNSSINTNSIQSISLNSEKIGSGSGENKGLGFKEVFQDVIKNVEETEAATKLDAYNLSIGNVDDMHTMIINAAKADVALQTMVQLRNKILDAYTEVMRTNL
ncbi:flagellar hook-basal body complex protein FliE [Clostridiales bacterium BAD-6]|jgi:flagellar hook-basal body complex protein FliE|uniref:Flagellar hook-basal body complex protein FliE n=2 Tax=Sinanaerobacter chloroacetimidivorans TaxID=2818044 RepID=A0A8J7VYM5_9FIRM|nr:flagellar hook-basal body complex protein FliE [Sinanaerobacter chloroacetimidivorans]